MPRILRLFVAIMPPAQAAAALAEAAARICPAGHKVVHQGNIHLTAQFIGDTDERQLRATRESVERAAAGIGPFSLAPKELRTLPEDPRVPARLLAAMTDEPSPLSELHRRLAARLARRKPDKFPRFVPHLTLVRFDPARGAMPHVAVPLENPPFQVQSISLMQSRLHAAGAEYTELARCEL